MIIQALDPIRWLAQPVTVPLWGFVTCLLLPASFLAKVAKDKIEKRLGLNK